MKKVPAWMVLGWVSQMMALLGKEEGQYLYDLGYINMAIPLTTKQDTYSVATVQTISTSLDLPPSDFFPRVRGIQLSDSSTRTSLNVHVPSLAYDPQSYLIVEARGACRSCS